MPAPVERAVVLGAAGFIGTNLAHALVRKGVRVVLFDRNVSAHWPAAADVLTGDLAAPPAELLDAMQDAAVFHLAGHTRPSMSTAAVAAELQSEVAMTTGLLELSREVRARWVFVSSGGAVYGEALTPTIPETHPTDPISSYGIAKLAAEHYFRLYRRLHGTRYVVARLSNPFGPQQRTRSGQGIVPAIYDRLRRGKAVEIWGDGSVVRDYVFIDDVAAALVRLAEAGEDGRTYNVGSGVGTSIEQLVGQVARQLGVEPAVVRKPGRLIDVGRNVLDIARIRTETGWTPEHSLTEGLRKTFALLGEPEKAETGTGQ